MNSPEIYQMAEENLANMYKKDAIFYVNVVAGLAEHYSDLERQRGFAKLVNFVRHRKEDTVSEMQFFAKLADDQATRLDTVVMISGMEYNSDGSFCPGIVQEVLNRRENEARKIRNVEDAAAKNTPDFILHEYRAERRAHMLRHRDESSK